MCMMCVHRGSGVPRLKPRKRRPLGLAQPQTGVQVRGVEIVQCVQDVTNSVPLVADKATLVRLYLEPTSVSLPGQITAEIAWSRSGGGDTFVPALNSLRVDPGSPFSLREQREDIDKSLNFRLPAAAIGAGTLNLRISRIFQPGGGDLPAAAFNIAPVTFAAAPPLRIRVIGLRYRAGTTTVTPAAVHFSYLKSFLNRAYPVAALEWSHMVVDADFAAPFDDSTVDLANAQIAALRSREVSSGVDPRTHYYGLVDDNASNNFMRGKAFAIPGTPQPDTVASGPAGVPNGFAGDRDASYADWYGAHELGHTFGRFHPGFPPAAQDASDPTFPYENGCISKPDNKYVGVDTGDHELGLPAAALPGLTYHDVMTYADNQWLSAYTYQAIMTRLLEEDALGPPVA
ncbi:hypothetical protein ACVWXN_005666 [Bradyrhizobium sp. i1.4.4]